MDANTMTGRVKYGVIGAMTEEVEMLKNDMAITGTVSLYGLTFYEGMLAGRNVVVVYSGIGKVNAAVTTSLLIDRFMCTAVIFTGVAGSLNSDIGI
ncbi:MAG: 5'-methylthioadenosine/S-adenosylhomocysteine nucleosidase, partial [Eubacteriaceae bacterium]|nr:5'-methylthioadenosine/S-adenosylhomocysteine nucleosidase [Eubacteriaceae bacterium]